MTKFQIILMGVFAAFIVLGLIIFSVYRGASEGRSTVTIWGSIPASEFNSILQESILNNNKDLKIDISYAYRASDEFDQSFIEALASGVGPDLFILASDKIIKHENKIFPIPYSVFTERDFKDSFIEGSEIYTSPEGILALPLYVDPLVMYWNRSIFNAVQVTEPPKYWDEFYSLASLISDKDGALNIRRSALAFGEFSNVTNAKSILATLFMQAGTPIVSSQGNQIRSVLNYGFDKPIIPAEAAINFYTEFSNPSKKTYSWNRSLPNSLNYFLGGDLGLYFGFASEISLMQIKNPNLNFDVASVPASRDVSDNITFGKFYGVSIAKFSKNASAAFTIANILTSKDMAKSLSDIIKLPPARRDLLSERQSDAYKSVFYKSAIKARGWLDPEPIETNAMFRNMIESITSGRSRTSEAIQRANGELNALFSR